MKLPKTNRFTFVVVENEWRSYRGQKKTFVWEREIPGAEAEQSVILETKDFASAADPLKSWAQIDQFGICAHYAERGAPAQRTPAWNGPAATFIRLEWI